MKFITAEEASKKWKIGLRSVQRKCASGQIEGAEKRANIWMIPETAEPQRGKRTKENVLKDEILETYHFFVQKEYERYSEFFSQNQLCKSPVIKAWYLAVEAYKHYPYIEKMAEYWEKSKKYVEQTGIKVPEISLTMGGHMMLPIFLYQPGKADECSKIISEKLPIFEVLTGRKSGIGLLFQAELAYHRGNIPEAEVLCYKTLLYGDCDPDIRLGIAYVLAHVSFHKGDIQGWKRACMIIKEVMEKGEDEIATTSAEIAKAELLLAAGFTEGVPEWIQTCDFTNRNLTATMQASVLFLHVSFLCRSKEYARAVAVADALLKKVSEERYVSSFSLLYLYMIMALCYGQLSMEERCKEFLARALEIAKPDKLILPFVEYSYDMNGISDRFLERNEPEIYEKVIEIKEVYRKNYVSLRIALKEPELIVGLTDREKEIAELVADGMSNAEIAEKLYISKSTVNYHIQNIFRKLGVNRRSMMIKILYFNDKQSE